jgi:hypothetical protein
VHGFLENLPFDGTISMEIGTLGKFPWINGNMPRGQLLKSCKIF